MYRMPTEPVVEMRVYVRDILSGSWENFSMAEWTEKVEEYYNGAATAFHLTFGGTLTLSGTNESGRASVVTADGETVYDYDWYTLNRHEAYRKD